MSNFGDGFAGFQNLIAAATEAIGEPALQPAVAKHAIACLEVEVRASRGLSGWAGLSWGSWWTTCTSAEFDAGRERAEATLLLPTSSLAPPASAEGRWRGTMLRLRVRTLQAEGGGYRVRAGSFFDGPWRYDRALRKDVPHWQISMEREFLDCAGIGVGSSQPQTTHAKSEENAAKALRRMARDFLGVELRDL